MLIKIDHDFHEHLTETEKKVINFINMNVEAISSMSISDVAEKTFSSPATVSRTIKKCGISGFAELRYLLTQETQTKKDDVDVNEIFNKSLLEVSNTIDHLSIDTILDVVKEIRSAKRIYLLSRGLSEHVAQEFALKLQILGFNVFENSDPAIMQEMTSHVKKQELVIIFSLSGKTPELLTAAENASSLGARIITITCGDPDVPLARIAHVAVYGYKHKHVSITSVDATSRLPLYVISRILIDYITKQMNAEEERRQEKKKPSGRQDTSEESSEISRQKASLTEGGGPR